MSKKKIIAIVLFILMGFVMFTFANPSDGISEITKKEDTPVKKDDEPVTPIVVVDNAPVIYVNPTTVTLVEGSNYDVMTGVSVVDDKDKGLKATPSITDVNEVGEYEVTYTVYDSAKNGATAKRTIIVLDKLGDEDGDHYTNEEEYENKTDFLDKEDVPDYPYAPSIDLEGIETSMLVYDEIPEFEAVCTDEFYGTEGVNCEITHEIDNNNIGTYTVTVTCTDNLENETVETFDFEVLPREVTVEINDATSKYGEKPSKLTYKKIEGELEEHKVGVTLTAQPVTDYANKVKTDAGIYEITGDYTNKNYLVTFVNGTYTVKKAKIGKLEYLLAFPSKTRVYDGKEHSIGVITSMLKEGSTVAYSAETTRTNAGIYNVTATISNKNYEDVKLKAALIITKRLVGLNVDNKTSVYGEALEELTYSVKGLVKGETLSNVTLDTNIPRSKDAGIYAIFAKVPTQANYEVVVSNGIYAITKANYEVPETVKFDAVTAEYDGKNHTATVTGLAKGIKVNYSNNSRKNAGSQTATATFTFNKNYNETKLTTTITVNKKALVIKANDATSVYGKDIKNNIGYTQTGLVKGEKITGVTVSTDAKKGDSVGTYTTFVNVKNGSMSNYDITTTNGTYTITKATDSNDYSSLFTNKTVDYDGTEQTITMTSVPEGYTASYTNNTRTSAGSQTATVVLTNSNYNDITLTATLTVNKKAITVSADNKTSNYGDEIVELTATPNAGINGEDLNISLSTTATSTSAVGTYPITVSASNDNYDITLNNGTYTITPAPYDEDEFVVSGVEVTYDGNKHNITVSYPEEATVSYKVDNQAFDGAINVGTYTVTATFSVPNYRDIVKTATLKITEKTLTVTAPTLSVTYGENPTLNGQISGLLATDEEPTVIYNIVDQNGNNVSELVPGTYTVVPVVTNVPTNYSLNTVNGTLTVTKSIIDMANVSFNDKEVAYNGNEQVVEITGVLPEGVTVSYENNKGTNAGEYNAVAKFDVDTTKYEAIANMTATLTITKINPETEEVTGLTGTEGENLSDVELPNGYTLVTEDEVLVVPTDLEETTKDIVLNYCPVDTTNYNCVNVDATVVVNAKYFTESFVSNGVVVDTIDVRLNTKGIQTSVVPTKANYEFAGWDKDVTNMTITGDVTVTAIFNALQTGLVIYDTPNAHFEFTQDRNNNSDALIRNIMIVKEVYADGTEKVTTSYTTNFDLKEVGDKTLTVSENGFTAYHAYKVITNIAYQTKFEVISSVQNTYRETKKSTCTSNCDSQGNTREVKENFNFLEVIEHYDENIEVNNIDATYADNTKKTLDVTEKVRWSRYEDSAYWDPVRIARSNDFIYTGWFQRERDDVETSSNPIKYVDITYTRTGYGKYLLRFEKQVDGTFKAIAEEKIG